MIRTKIVTSRNTAFIVGFPKDTSENSPKIVSIELIQDTEAYWVTFDNDETVEVKDAVEIWKSPE